MCLFVISYALKMAPKNDHFQVFSTRTNGQSAAREKKEKLEATAFCTAKFIYLI